MPARSLPTLAAAGVAAILAAVALLTAASAAPATAPPRPSSSVSEHDNYIYFDSNTTITVTFTEQAHTISSGQPYDGVSSTGTALDVKAGRHGSTGPAAAFTDGISFLNMLATEKMLAMAPKDLNFVVEGILNVTFANGPSLSCPGMRVGQGHYGFTNNWWAGSSNCLGLDIAETYRTCSCGSTGKLQIHETGKSDHFYIIPA